jgi:hypothetical protein
MNESSFCGVERSHPMESVHREVLERMTAQYPVHWISSSRSHFRADHFLRYWSEDRGLVPICVADTAQGLWAGTTYLYWRRQEALRKTDQLNNYRTLYGVRLALAICSDKWYRLGRVSRFGHPVLGLVPIAQDRAKQLIEREIIKRNVARI